MATTATQFNGEVYPFFATTSVNALLSHSDVLASTGFGYANSTQSQHITSYPLISDSLDYVKQNPYGQKGLQLTDSAYKAFAKRLPPLLTKPYEYVSPYVKKADSMSDGALSQLDERFPALKKPTHELWTDGKNLVFFPVHKGAETKEHVFTVYGSEYKKVGGDGVVTTGKALISTGMVVAVEALNWMSGMMKAGETKAKEMSVEAANRA